MFVLLEELQEWRALPELLGESRTGASKSGYSRFILKSKSTELFLSVSRIKFR